LPAAWLGPLKLAGAGLGLPIDVSPPANLKLRLGERLNITHLSKSD
jgi:hypothetical protein